MKKNLIIFGALTFALIASAAAEQHILLVFDSNGEGARETFSMDPGACLIGPLRFKDRDGKIHLSLDAGVEYPSGCSALARGMTCQPGTTFTIENINGTTHIGCKPTR